MPLLRFNRCGHPTLTHLAQSRRAGNPAPTAPPCDLSHSQAAWGPSCRDRGTLDCRQNLQMDIVVRRGGLRNAPNTECRDKSILVEVTHADPQAQVHVRTGSADHDGPAASTPEACKRQHYTRPGHVPFNVRSHKLATVAVERFGRLGVEGGYFIDQLVASVVRGRARGRWRRKGC